MTKAIVQADHLRAESQSVACDGSLAAAVVSQGCVFVLSKCVMSQHFTFTSPGQSVFLIAVSNPAINLPVANQLELSLGTSNPSSIHAFPFHRPTAFLSLYSHLRPQTSPEPSSACLPACLDNQTGPSKTLIPTYEKNGLFSGTRQPWPVCCVQFLFLTSASYMHT